MKRFHLGGALCLAAAAWAGAASADCHLQTIAEYPLTMDGDRALVNASINGRSVRLLVDTGSYATIITRSAAADMGLTLSRVAGLDTYDVNGVDVTDVTDVREFKLGGMTGHDIQLIVTAKDLNSDAFQGLLGQSILAQGDMELDFADNVMRLFRPAGCSGDQVVYWGKAYSAAQIAPSNDSDELNVYVSLNGQRVVAKLDTGASTTIVTAQTAARVGAPAGFSSSTAVFPSVAVGDETVKNARLAVADLFANDTDAPTNTHIARKINNLPDMLLGADFIRAHRIYIARSQGKIYFSYNGGPIFQTPDASAPPPTPAKP